MDEDINMTDLKNTKKDDNEGQADTDLDLDKGSTHLKEKYFPGYDFGSMRIDDHNEYQDGLNDSDHAAFDATWTQLSEIVMNEVKLNRKRGMKRNPRDMYDQIINGLVVRSEKVGFTKDELLLIWKVVSHRDHNLNCAQRGKLVFLMLPTTRVEGKVVKSIVNWLHDASKGHRPTVILRAMQLLNLYIEYQLLEEGDFFNESMLTKILSAQTDNYVISWKMRLFRHIVNPSILNVSHILKLNQLLRIKELKKTQVDDVTAALGVCKYLRPDMFENDEDFNWKVRDLKYPKDVGDQFYKCKLRTQEQTVRILHPMADRVFPEFLPKSYRLGSGSLLRRNIHEDMLAYLGTKRGMNIIANTPVLFQEFQQWLRLVIFHRFHIFLGTYTDEDFWRYVFIFERCVAITKAKREGIPVLNQWVVQFLAIWDFKMFKTFIHDILPYLTPTDILLPSEEESPNEDHAPTDTLSSKESLSQVLPNRFLTTPWISFEIWDVLTELYDRWITDPVSNSDGVEWVIDVLGKCVSSLRNAIVLSGQQMDALLLNICRTYHKMLEDFKDKPDLKPETKEKMFNLPFELITCAFRFGSRAAIEALLELVLFRSEVGQNKRIDDFTLTFHMKMVDDKPRIDEDASSDRVGSTMAIIKSDIIKSETYKQFLMKIMD